MAKPRTFYAEDDAKEALKNFEESGLSRRRYAKLTGIPESTIRHWREKLPGKRGRKKSQQMLDMEAESKRITRDSDIKKAADQVSKELNLKRNVSRTWVWKWKKADGITYRIPTKVGRKTKDTEEVIKAMEKYEAQLEEMHNQLIDPSTIWNMDKTSVKLQNPYRNTLALKGANEVPTVQPPGGKENMTVLLMVAADGTKYPAVIVFKGAKKTGKLKIPENVIVKSNQKGWWTNDFDLVYLKEAFPANDTQVTQILRCDHCKAHLSQNSVDLLQERGVQQLLIPKGKTGDKKPLNVRVNGPLKAIMRRIYREWMDNRTALTKSGYLKEPSRQDFVNFVSQAWEEVSPLTIESSLVKAGVLPEPTYMLADYVPVGDDPFEFDFEE
ncbi:hypothetical protein RvY_02678 [Ramazzottius varieornatus]|uniref:DDE-1 domain-containing protein n=1 Tax=Ramazzottius varieornatus TaxID=947166 RepID=A0A1D1UNZ1_RAMVA|nr:hypothetical protein RvY_02678 [Ramazzottius varieornatus]